MLQNVAKALFVLQLLKAVLTAKVEFLRRKKKSSGGAVVEGRRCSMPYSGRKGECFVVR